MKPLDRLTPIKAEAEELHEPPRCGLEELPPPDVYDPVVETYKRDVDRTLLIQNLKLTPAQRAEKLESFVEMLFELRQATKAWRT
jgi:hypothetical protein